VFNRVDKGTFMRVSLTDHAPIQIRLELGDWRAKELTNTVIIGDIGQYKGVLVVR